MYVLHVRMTIGFLASLYGDNHCWTSEILASNHTNKVSN